MSQAYTWGMSALTLYTMWQAGNGRARAWVVGLVSQAMWVGFIVHYHTWGLMPLTLLLIGTYARNLYRAVRNSRVRSLR